MKEETSEPNRNEKDIKHRVLSWCGEHKMQTATIGTILLLSLGGILFCLQEEGQCELVTVETEFIPKILAEDKEMSTLSVKITPMVDMEENITIEISPQNWDVLEIKRTGGTISIMPEVKYSYEVKRQFRKQGETFQTNFDVTSKCDCNKGDWTVETTVIVGDDCRRNTENHFIIGIEEIKEEGKAGGACLGAFLLVGSILTAGLIRSHRNKEHSS